MRGPVVLLLVVGLTAPVVAGSPSGKVVLDLWDVAYVEGGRAGHIHTYTEEIGSGDSALLRTTVELRLTLKRFNDTVQVGMDTGTIETPGGIVTGVFVRQYLGQNRRLEIKGTVIGDRLHLVQDGVKKLEPAPWNDEVVGLYRQHKFLESPKLKPGVEYSYLSFEPSINLVLRTDVAVKDLEEVELFGGKERHKLLRVESRPQMIERVQLPTLTIWRDGARQQRRGEVAVPGLGKFQLYRTTREDALDRKGAVAKTDIGFSQLVRLSQRIVRPYDTTAAVYRITLQGDQDPGSAFARDERQQVKNVNGSSFELHVRAQRGPAAATAEPDAEFLRSSYFINCDDARVKELSRQAVGAERDPWQKALRVERWVRANMRSVHHDALAPADEAARTLEGDCTEYAMLAAALCRAAGVPSRTAVGLIYADVKGAPVFAFHMWTEVWAHGQWRPLDATLGRGYVGATHLKIAAHSWHEAITVAPLFPVVRVLGRVSIEVLGVESR